MNEMNVNELIQFVKLFISIFINSFDNKVIDIHLSH